MVPPRTRRRNPGPPLPSPPRWPTEVALAAVERRDGGILIRVRVQPKASRNAVVLEADGRVRVALTAPPVDGAANKALVQFLARFLGVKKRDVRIESGERGREKTILVLGGDFDDVCDRLQSV